MGRPKRKSEAAGEKESKKRGRKPGWKKLKKEVDQSQEREDDVEESVESVQEKEEVEDKDVTPVKKEEVEVKLPPSLRDKLKNNIMSIFEISCDLLSYKMVGDYFEEKSVLRTADSIVLFCQKLNLSLPTLLTALVYLQLYKNSSKNWRSSKLYYIANKNVKKRKFLKWDEQYLTSAACVLLAWKYKEDEIGLVKSTKKLFDLSVTMYKIIVSQSSRKSSNMSVSSWMLQDNGEEIKTLKSQIVDRENQLLHALDYFIGPIPLPDTIISPYVKLFLTAVTDDFSEHQSYAKRLQEVVSLLVIDIYKTQMCIDYTPNEIVAVSIIKASCLLSFTDENDDIFNFKQWKHDFHQHAFEIERRLNNFIESLGEKGLELSRVVSGLMQVQKYAKIFKHSTSSRDS